MLGNFKYWASWLQISTEMHVNVHISLSLSFDFKEPWNKPPYFRTTLFYENFIKVFSDILYLLYLNGKIETDLSKLVSQSFSLHWERPTSEDFGGSYKEMIINKLVWNWDIAFFFFLQICWVRKVVILNFLISGAFLFLKKILSTYKFFLGQSTHYFFFAWII